MNPIRLTRPEALDAWQPLERCLIACEVFDRYNHNPYLPGHEAQASLREIWAARTYEIYRDGDEWRLDFGEGRLEYRATWEDVVGWFKAMRPRNIEVLIDYGGGTP